MKEDNFTTPILFLTWNRPTPTLKVWAKIVEIKPSKIYIASDGPRSGNKLDRDLIKKVREAVTQNTDWPCEIKTLFREKNLGCGEAIKGALDWFFSQEKEGIILEDDCLPHRDFFYFSQEMLEKYRNQEKIFLISGSSIVEDYASKLDEDYFFTYIPSAWGWATWKRSIDRYDFNLSKLEEFIAKNKIELIFRKRKHQNFWLDFFREVKNKKINNWDYQLAFSSFNNLGLCLRPRYNLVTNLGIDFIASGQKKHKFQNNGLKIKTHPLGINQNRVADEKIMQSLLSPTYFLKLFLKRLGIFTLARKLYKKI